MTDSAASERPTEAGQGISGPRATESMWSRGTIAMLLLILVLASAMRWHGITARGFFFDELWIAEVSNGHGSEYFDIPLDRVVDQPNTLLMSNARPMWQVPTHTTGVIHPPATFVMLRAWRDVFGDSMLALRSCSATWSVIVVLLCYVAAAQSFGRSAGLWAALSSAVSLGNIDQAQDTRGYTMLEAFLLLTAIALVRLRGRTSSSGRGAAVVGVGTLLLMFTHYFAAGACVAIVFGAITLLRGRTRWQTLAAIAFSGMIWLVLWGPSLRAQLAYVPETADIFLLDRSESPHLATLLRLLASPYQSLVGDPRPDADAVLYGGLILCALLVVRALRGSTDAPLSRFWFAMLIGGASLLTAIDLTRDSKHLEFPKYLQLLNPALCVLLGSLAVGRVRWIAPALLSIALAVTALVTPRSPKPDLRPPLQYLTQHASPDDLILLPAQLERGRDGQARYLSVAHVLPWPTIRLAVPLGPQSAEWVSQLPRDRRWFCLTFTAYDVDKWLPGATIIDRGPTSSGVTVYELRYAGER